MITLANLFDPFDEERHTLQLILAIVSDDIHEAVAALQDETDELIITITRRVSPDREPMMSDDWLAVSEDEEEPVPVL